MIYVTISAPFSKANGEIGDVPPSSRSQLAFVTSLQILGLPPPRQVPSLSPVTCDREGVKKVPVRSKHVRLKFKGSWLTWHRIYIKKIPYLFKKKSILVRPMVRQPAPKSKVLANDFLAKRTCPPDFSSVIFRHVHTTKNRQKLAQIITNLQQPRKSFTILMQLRQSWIPIPTLALGRHSACANDHLQAYILVLIYDNFWRF